MHDLPNRPVNDIINGIEMYLQKAGLYFRIFGRIKLVLLSMRKLNERDTLAMENICKIW